MVRSSITFDSDLAFTFYDTQVGIYGNASQTESIIVRARWSIALLPFYVYATFLFSLPFYRENNEYARDNHFNECTISVFLIIRQN